MLGVSDPHEVSCPVNIALNHYEVFRYSAAEKRRISVPPPDIIDMHNKYMEGVWNGLPFGCEYWCVSNSDSRTKLVHAKSIMVSGCR